MKIRKKTPTLLKNLLFKKPKVNLIKSEIIDMLVAVYVTEMAKLRLTKKTCS